MAFERMVPSSVSELLEYLKKLSENINHVKSAVVNSTQASVMIDLSGMANFGGYPDIRIPVKRSKLVEAQALVDSLIRSARGGAMPSEADARKLFDMIDPQGQ
jgi:hypothetical protein